MNKEESELTIKIIVFNFLYLKDKYKEAEKVPVDKMLIEMGADSLDCIEMVMQVEEELDVVIPDQMVTDDLTIEKIMKYLEGGEK